MHVSQMDAVFRAKGASAKGGSTVASQCEIRSRDCHIDAHIYHGFGLRSIIASHTTFHSIVFHPVVGVLEVCIADPTLCLSVVGPDPKK